MAVLLAAATVGAAPIVHPGRDNAAPITFTSTAINQAGGNCANVPSSANGAQPVLAGCHGSAAQKTTPSLAIRSSSGTRP